MTQPEQTPQRRLDAATYFAIWLTLLLGAIVLLRLFMRDDAAVETAVLPTTTILATTTAAPALSTLTPTIPATATAPPSPTLTNTNTPVATNTSIPTATDTHTPSPTIPPTQLPMNTSTPHPQLTATPSALPTPHEIYSWTLRVPILMYHYVSVPPEDADIYRTDLSVTPENFRAQMAYLAENGYTTIDFYTLSLAIADKIDLPDKPVIITLDDGYRDNYDNAFPILQEYGHTATFFIVTEFIDNGQEAYVTWEMVEEMAAAGMRMESHTKTHPDLRGQSRDHLIWQILGSQQTLEAHIGYTPRYFAYPAGQYDENTITILEELNFWGAVTTLGGKWHGYESRYEWRRLRIRNDTYLPEFVDLVDPADTVGGRTVTE